MVSVRSTMVPINEEQKIVNSSAKENKNSCVRIEEINIEVNNENPQDQSNFEEGNKQNKAKEKEKEKGKNEFESIADCSKSEPLEVPNNYCITCKLVQVTSLLI